MGYIALEMCEALRERSIAVDMVKPRETFLPWMEARLAEQNDQLAARDAAIRRYVDAAAGPPPNWPYPAFALG